MTHSDKTEHIFSIIGGQTESADHHLSQSIAETEEALRLRILEQFLSEGNTELSISDFLTLKPAHAELQKSETYYDALKAHLMRFRISKYLESRLDTTLLTHSEFCNLCDALCSAQTPEEFERIHLDALAKYEKRELEEGTL